MDNNIFSRNLRKAIEIRGYKQVDVARATQIPKSLLNEYLSGRCKPRKEYLSRLSDFLQVSDEWLLGHHVPLDAETQGINYIENFRENMAHSLESADPEEVVAAEIDKEYMSAVIDGKIKPTLEEAANIADELGKSLPEMFFLDRVVERANEVRRQHELEPYNHKWIDNFQNFLKNYIESDGAIGSFDKDDLIAVADGYVLSFNGYCQLADKLGLSLDEMVGLNAHHNKKTIELLNLFNQLTAEQQSIVIAQIKGILSGN